MGMVRGRHRGGSGAGTTPWWVWCEYDTVMGVVQGWLRDERGTETAGHVPTPQYSKINQETAFQLPSLILQAIPFTVCFLPSVVIVP